MFPACSHQTSRVCAKEYLCICMWCRGASTFSHLRLESVIMSMEHCRGFKEFFQDSTSGPEFGTVWSLMTVETQIIAYQTKRYCSLQTGLTEICLWLLLQLAQRRTCDCTIIILCISTWSLQQALTALICNIVVFPRGRTKLWWSPVSWASLSLWCGLTWVVVDTIHTSVGV